MNNRPTLSYIVVAVLIVGVMVFSAANFRTTSNTAEAREKAAELSAAFEDAGLPPPSENLVVRTLGEDGGSVCRNPDNALNRASLDRQLSNGAAQTGVRPIIADRRVVESVRLRIDIYCPQRLPEFRVYLQNLESADMIRD